MLTLIKLAAYGLLGYALYEFFRGLTSGAPSRRQLQRHPLAEGVRSSIQHEIESRHQQPQGQRVATSDADGSSASHFVGRGVVHR